MDGSDLWFVSVPTLDCFTILGEKWPLYFTGVDFAGIVTRVDVLLQLIFSWRVLRVRMIVSERQWALTWRGGGSKYPILKRTQGVSHLGNCNFVFNSGMVSWIFLIWDL